MTIRSLSIRLPHGGSVSALIAKPRKATSCFVFAHGAGAGMDHAFMQAIAQLLSDAKIASLRYQFPYMEAHSRRPDRPAVCHATIRATVDIARKQIPSVPLIAGGKSFGGRMTSQTQALEPLPGVVGLAFFGFPWHPAKAPALKRSEHLEDIKIPMLFMQGGRDTMGDPSLVKSWIRRHRQLATLKVVPEADHGFHVPFRSRRTDADVHQAIVHTFATWVPAIV